MRLATTSSTLRPRILRGLPVIALSPLGDRERTEADGLITARRSCWSRPPPTNLEPSRRSGTRRPAPCHVFVTQPQQSIQAAVTIDRRGARHPVAKYPL